MRYAAPLSPREALCTTHFFRDPCTVMHKAKIPTGAHPPAVSPTNRYHLDTTGFDPQIAALTGCTKRDGRKHSARFSDSRLQADMGVRFFSPALEPQSAHRHPIDPCLSVFICGPNVFRKSCTVLHKLAPFRKKRPVHPRSDRHSLSRGDLRRDASTDGDRKIHAGMDGIAKEIPTVHVIDVNVVGV